LRGQPPQSYSQKKSEIVNKFTLDNVTFLWYIIGMKSKKIKARVNKEGLMGPPSSKEGARLLPPPRQAQQSLCLT
jgi:hypothetical protein